MDCLTARGNMRDSPPGEASGSSLTARQAPTPRLSGWDEQGNRVPGRLASALHHPRNWIGGFKNPILEQKYAEVRYISTASTINAAFCTIF